MWSLLCGVGVSETLVQTKGFHQPATTVILCVTDPRRQPFLGNAIFPEMDVDVTLTMLLCFKTRATCP